MIEERFVNQIEEYVHELLTGLVKRQRLVARLQPQVMAALRAQTYPMAGHESLPDWILRCTRKQVGVYAAFNWKETLCPGAQDTQEASVVGALDV